LSVIVSLEVAGGRSKSQEVIKVVEHVGSVECLGYCGITERDWVTSVRSVIEDVRALSIGLGEGDAPTLWQDSGLDVVPNCTVVSIVRLQPTVRRSCGLLRIYDDRTFALPGIIDSDGTSRSGEPFLREIQT
jgi:hypothetical protein